ncbi:MAG TPA: histidine kinase [Chitinophagaceae bacterium]|nr:histidine kinase [Chitinophagaceae bacterium]
MIKDLMLKLVFIPLLGIALPYISGIVTYSLYSATELLIANLYFILTSFSIWTGCNWVHTRLRPLYKPLSQPFSKIITVCTVSVLYTLCIGSLLVFIWFVLSRDTFTWSAQFRFLSVCCAAVIIFTLVYEVLYLSKEREIDTRVVDQLDRERSYAELQALTNEMDPHFLFNSLNTLNYLIRENAEQAYIFNNRLAQVYKYFLINKNKELIPLQQELDFIADYFYLLQIRHDDKLRMQVLPQADPAEIRIPPCAIQVLIENAIKHNEFSEQAPLLITITIKKGYLEVANNVRAKTTALPSTGIGLTNLRSRYRIILKEDIHIEVTPDLFTVKLPLVA